MPHHTAKAQPAWLRQRKTHLMIGLALVAMAGGAVILARLRPRISRFLAETMAEVAGQMSVEFAPTGAIPVIVSSNGREAGSE